MNRNNGVKPSLRCQSRIYNQPIFDHLGLDKGLFFLAALSRPRDRPSLVPGCPDTTGSYREALDHHSDNPDRGQRARGPGGLRGVVRLGLGHGRRRERRPGPRRGPGHRADRRLAVDEQHHGVRQRVDLDLRADLPDAVHRDAERQGRPADAGDRLHGLGGQEDLHVHPAARGEVLHRPADDVGGREVLHRPGERSGQGLGLHQHGHQVRGRAHAVHGRGHAQVPVGAAARRPVAVLQRDRARQLRRQDRDRSSTTPRSAPVRSSGTTGTRAARSSWCATPTTGRRASRTSTA